MLEGAVICQADLNALDIAIEIPNYPPNVEDPKEATQKEVGQGSDWPELQVESEVVGGPSGGPKLSPDPGGGGGEGGMPIAIGQCGEREPVPSWTGRSFENRISQRSWSFPWTQWRPLCYPRP